MTLWQPSDAPNLLAMHYDASVASSLFDATSGGSNSTSGGYVLRMEDLSGNGRHLTTASSTTAPTRRLAVQNGLDVVRFGGSNDYLFNTANVAASGVQKHVFLQSLRSASQLTGSGPGYWRVLSTTDGIGPDDFNGGFAFINGVDGAGNALAYSCFTRESAGTGAINDVTLGRNAKTLVQYNNGDVCEVVIYTTKLSVPDQQRMQGYLAWKWGTVDLLAVDHPYKTYAPTNSNRRQQHSQQIIN